ncbi:MAG: hypothetical protein WDM79_14580 [Terricaulis sp.]
MCRSSSAASFRPPTRWPLRQMGVVGVYTPKDFKITGIMADVVKLVAASTP